MIRLDLTTMNILSRIFDIKTKTAEDLSLGTYLRMAYLVGDTITNGMDIEKYGDVQKKQCNAFMTKADSSIQRMV